MVDIDRSDHPGQHPFMEVPDLYEGWEPSGRPGRELDSGAYQRVLIDYRQDR